MPQVLTAILVAVGVSATAATLIVAALTIAASLIFKGGSSAKADQSENTIRNPKPARVFIVGTRRSYGAAMLFANGPNGETADVWAYAEGPVTGIVQAYLQDDPITVSGGYVQTLTDGSYGGNNVQAGWNLGPATNTAHAPVVSLIADWTNSHRGDGICSGYLIKTPVGSADFLNVYPQGDNVTMSLVVRGQKLPDPREPGFDPSDTDTWVDSDNAALAHLWFRLVIKGDSYAEKIAPNEAMWIAAANDCDESYSLSAGGSEPKYRAWVMFDATAKPFDVEQEFLAAYDGWTAPDEEGALRVYSGRTYTPSYSITPDDIIDYSLQDGVPSEEFVNQIIVRHISADHDYLEVESEPWRDEADILARGQELTDGVDFQVPSHTQARRLAKRKMARLNAPYRGQVTVKHSKRNILRERYVNLTITEAGYTFFDGVVEIFGGERDYETGGAVIDWVMADPAVDEWTPAIEDGQPAPSQTKTYLAPLPTPTVSDATAELDTGDTVQIALTFTKPSESGSTWFSRWRLAGTATWNIKTHTGVEASGTLRTDSVPLDSSIEAAIAYTGTGGRTSSWSTAETVSTAAVDIAPGPNTAFTATGGTGDVSGGWTNSTSVNFGHSELWSGPDDDFANAAQLGADYSGNAGAAETFTESLASGTHYVWSVAYNNADNAISLTGPVEVTVS